jgi:hypothetical protein
VIFRLFSPEAMHSDPLSFPSIPSDSAQPSPASGVPSDNAFAALYSEALEAANQETSQVASADSTDDGESAGADTDPMSFLELRASAFAAGSSLASANGDLSSMQAELMQHIAAIRFGPGQTSSDPAAVATQPGQSSHGPIGSCVHRLISWLDSHAHLHSTHLCAASVRQAMEAAGIQTGDRPTSGDAGDYGPFLLRHGAQVVSQGSEAKAGDIAVFDRTEDHPAGHIQVFDGQHWVSDFVQHTFSPYRDQQSTPPVTVYRLS